MKEKTREEKLYEIRIKTFKKLGFLKEVKIEDVEKEIEEKYKDSHKVEYGPLFSLEEGE